MKETSTQVAQNVVYFLLSEVIQYAAIRKAAGFSTIPVVNIHFVEVGSFIDRLLSMVEKKHNVQDDVKQVFVIESLPLEFDEYEAYILANQNLSINKKPKTLTNNKVQVLQKNGIGAKIVSIAMVVKLKRCRTTTFDNKKIIVAT